MLQLISVESKCSHFPPSERLSIIAPSFAALWESRNPQDLGPLVTIPDLALPNNTQVGAILREMKQEFTDGYLIGIFNIIPSNSPIPVGFATSALYPDKRLVMSTWSTGMTNYREILPPSDTLAFAAESISDGMEAIVVRPDMRESGIGTKLLDLHYLCAQALDCDYLEIQVSTSDQFSKFIRESGYSPVETADPSTGRPNFSIQINQQGLTI